MDCLWQKKARIAKLRRGTQPKDYLNEVTVLSQKGKGVRRRSFAFANGLPKVIHPVPLCTFGASPKAKGYRGTSMLTPFAFTKGDRINILPLVVAFGEPTVISPLRLCRRQRRRTYPFARGDHPYAPVPLYPFGVRGTCVAEGEGITGVQVHRGKGLRSKQG